ncbi:MAG TPA: hypothetical protein VED37_18675 [Ktedonobacteraceae bacterium]|nr:hypothetical protein [Ktedonobacteraceae bacterium]
MSTHSIEETTAPTQQPVEAKGSALHGVLIGLIPLGLLAGVVLLAVIATAIARELTVSGGFYAQQEAALITLIIGLVLAVVVFAIACWRVLHLVGLWQKAGAAVQAAATLWALGFTALVIISPILLALLLPQHPAP